MTEPEMPSHHGIGEEISGDYPNETLKLLIERSSCRSFETKQIPAEMMQLILRSGIHAATGGNLQPYSIIQIESQATRDVLAEKCGQAFMAKAPTHLLFCIDWHRIDRWTKLEQAPFSARDSFRHFWISFQDTIIAAQNICTAVDSLGLGSVYIGTVMEFADELRQLVSLPEGVFPVVLLCLGYPKGRPSPRKKLPPEVMVHRERYTELSDSELVESFRRKYPDLKIEITEARLKQIETVCRRVHGHKFAEETLARIKEEGYINAAQRYFGLHYVADMMREDNEQFVGWTKDSGFNWFDSAGRSRPDQSD